MQSCVYITDPSWLSSLERTGVRQSVNFWRKDRRSLRLLPGDLFYFKLKGSRSVAGRAYFREQLQLTATEAWERFREGNGAVSQSELETRAQRALKMNGGSLNCLILDGLEILPTQARPQIRPGDFPGAIQNCKFFKQGSLPSVEASFSEPRALSTLVGAEAEASTEGQFDPRFISTIRAMAIRAICVRRGQRKFRKDLLAAYNDKCCVTGETAPAILEAAHIHPYRGADTNQVANGLLLRTDLHTLFDFGLWTLEDTFTIRLSSHIISSKSYAGYDGATIAVPNKPQLRPSKAALRFHREMIFKA